MCNQCGVVEVTDSSAMEVDSAAVPDGHEVLDDQTDETAPVDVSAAASAVTTPVKVVPSVETPGGSKLVATGAKAATGGASTSAAGDVDGSGVPTSGAGNTFDSATGMFVECSMCW